MSYRTHINTPFGSSELIIGRGLADVTSMAQKRRTVIVTDSHIESIYAEALSVFELVIIPQGEQAKDLVHLQRAAEELVERGINRDAILVAFGGGSICDFTGFLATVYKRGITFGYVPTTLLAQVDAAIGGKNGVNLGPYKNMLGTFAAPEFILIDPGYNRTLSKTDGLQGFAEVIKHALISDAKFFKFLMTNVRELLQMDLSVLEQCIRRAVEIKVEVVQRDARETGERKKLNFGHTVGHAIEKKAGLPHGFAVSIGMCAALNLSVHRGLLSTATRNRAVHLMEVFGLPTGMPDSIDVYWPLLIKDKKAKAQAIDFILLNDIGQSDIVEIPVDVLYKELKEIEGSSQKAISKS